MAGYSLLPALERTPQDTLVIADGFSCRSQIEQLGAREALHVAQVVQGALREAERTGPETLAAPPRRRGRLLAAGVAALSLAAPAGLATAR